MVYLTKHKSEVAEKIKDYASKAEAQWNLKIAKLRYDNSREYINNLVT